MIFDHPMLTAPEFVTLDTPFVAIDRQIARQNIAAQQARCDALGLANRPHIKTHKLASMAEAQLAAGAVGITCQKVSEALAMVRAAEIGDVFISYNMLGPRRLVDLKALSELCTLSVSADNAETIIGLGAAFANGPDLAVLIECDTGAGRMGVQTPEEATALARLVEQTAGLRLAGLMTYQNQMDPVGTNDWLSRALGLIGRKDLTVSCGGSPSVLRMGEIPVATEWRAGTNIYCDRFLIEKGVAQIEDCALRVVATVVSRPTPHRAIIDAGSKALTSDLLGLTGHGQVIGHPMIEIPKLAEEHGWLTSQEPLPLNVGDRVEILPNHACVVSNLVDQVILHDHGNFIGTERVAARGAIT